LSDQLVDLEAMEARPAPDVLATLSDFVRPVLEERGEWQQVSTTTSFVLGEGTGARRQRRAHTDDGGLRAVVDRTAIATAAGTF
jgi:carboxylate-amine ligase